MILRPKRLHYYTICISKSAVSKKTLYLIEHFKKSNLIWRSKYDSEGIKNMLEGL